GPYEYSMDGEKLLLSGSGLRLRAEDDGGLMDEDGKRLFASGLPDFEALEAKRREAAKYFYGCWEYNEYNGWVVIGEYPDGGYKVYDQEGNTRGELPYELRGESLYLTADNISFAPDGRGGIAASDGYSLFASDLPDFDAVANAEETETAAKEYETLQILS
ncbi:MAG: hypothetical protein IJC39_05140, partial [Firmicutes bacterium]|nr:hypothetical protein [Bacillota bacterium]